MIVEQKKLSPTEILLFASSKLPIIGCHHSKDTNNIPSIISNLKITELSEEILISSDFIYLKSTSIDTLEDLTLLAIAELDDFITTTSSPTLNTENTETKIILLLKTIVAPFLNKDGGDIEFVSYKNNIVSVKFLGKCNGCPYAARTLKERVEKNLIHYLPEIKEAILV